jgi:hypothetical protein
MQMYTYTDMGALVFEVIPTVAGDMPGDRYEVPAAKAPLTSGHVINGEGGFRRWD